MGLARVRRFAARSLCDPNDVRKHRQKPSNASPTQLNANIEEAIAATNAKVAMVLTGRITEPLFRR
jgi:hypothetical protein